MNSSAQWFASASGSLGKHDQKDGTVCKGNKIGLLSNKWDWSSDKYDSSSENRTIYKIDFFQKKGLFIGMKKLLVFKIRKRDNFNVNVDVGTGDNMVSVDVRWHRCMLLHVTLAVYSIDDYHCKVPKQLLTGMHLVFQ